jgi:hypothetical protein
MPHRLVCEITTHTHIHMYAPVPPLADGAAAARNAFHCERSAVVSIVSPLTRYRKYAGAARSENDARSESICFDENRSVNAAAVPVLLTVISSNSNAGNASQ